VQQALLVLVAVDLLEARLDAALEVLDAAVLLEQVQELLRLVALDLAVLDRRAAQQVVQLDGLVRRHAGLVLRGVLAQPEVDVPAEARGGLLRLWWAQPRGGVDGAGWG